MRRDVLPTPLSPTMSTLKRQSLRAPQQEQYTQAVNHRRTTEDEGRRDAYYSAIARVVWGSSLETKVYRFGVAYVDPALGSKLKYINNAISSSL
jgi:hypothetical protein